MSDQTLKAAIGAAFFTLLFFLLIAFQPLLPEKAFSLEDASASPLALEDATGAPSQPDLLDAAFPMYAPSH